MHFLKEEETYCLITTLFSQTKITTYNSYEHTKYSSITVLKLLKHYTLSVAEHLQGNYLNHPRNTLDQTQKYVKIIFILEKHPRPKDKTLPTEIIIEIGVNNEIQFAEDWFSTLFSKLSFQTRLRIVDAMISEGK